jgi:hypothetical protein
MGCDIHAIVETDRFKVGYWDGFADGEFSIDRDYKLFSAIAFGDGGIKDKLPYPPRGLPDSLSEATKRSYFEPESELNGIRFWDSKTNSFRRTTKSEAKNRLKNGVVKTLYLKENLVPKDMVHTASWLYLSELDEALRAAQLKVEKLSSSFRAVHSVLKILAEDYGDKQVRLVYWFDN